MVASYQASMSSNLLRKESPQPFQLVAPLKIHQLTADRPAFATKHGPEIAEEESTTAYDIRPPAHLINRSEYLPHWMKPNVIGSSAELEIGHEFVLEIGRAHGPVMFTNFFGKGLGVPAFHSRREHSDHVQASACDGNITSDLLETFPPE